MVRLTRIYTKTGDEGFTSLGDGSRAKKSIGLIHLLGEIDELNSVVGLCRIHAKNPIVQVELQKMQHTLFDIGAVISIFPASNISTDTILAVEKQIDYFTELQGPLTSFILPGGTEAAAFLHLARTVARRAERRIWGMLDEGDNTNIAKYLNRLSDLFFVYARAENNGNDVLWQRNG